MFFIIMGSIGQWLALIATSGGIIIEILYEADVGFLCITSGSVFWGLFTKMKLIGYEADERRRKAYENGNRNKSKFSSKR